MDGVIQRGRDNNWSNLDEIIDEYTIFGEEEKKDREEATVNGVDLSNSLSLFRLVWFFFLLRRGNREADGRVRSKRSAYKIASHYE